MRHSLNPVRNTIIKMHNIINAAESVEKATLLVGNVNEYSHYVKL